ncbi:MAG TPA: hypothetical protein VF550_03225, partial [Polyangia bacterium]
HTVGLVSLTVPHGFKDKFTTVPEFNHGDFLAWGFFASFHKPSRPLVRELDGASDRQPAQ